jgi:hypothetical protein
VGGQEYVFVSELDTAAGSEKQDYWARRRNAASDSVEAFCVSVLCMLVQKGRGRCAVFMGAALTRDSRERSCLV